MGERIVGRIEYIGVSARGEYNSEILALFNDCTNIDSYHFSLMELDDDIQYYTKGSYVTFIKGYRQGKNIAVSIRKLNVIEDRSIINRILHQKDSKVWTQLIKVIYEIDNSEARKLLKQKIDKNRYRRIEHEWYLNLPKEIFHYKKYLEYLSTNDQLDVLCRVINECPESKRPSNIEIFLQKATNASEHIEYFMRIKVVLLIESDALLERIILNESNHHRRKCISSRDSELRSIILSRVEKYGEALFKIFDNTDLDYLIQNNARLKVEKKDRQVEPLLNHSVENYHYCQDLNGVYAFTYYYPKKHESFEKSKWLLEFKDGVKKLQEKEFDMVLNCIKRFDADSSRIGICLMPSSKMGMYGKGIELLIDDLLKQQKFVDLRKLLVRAETVEPSHGSNDRSKAKHLNSIKINKNLLIHARQLSCIVILDDITTTGNSLLSAEEIIKREIGRLTIYKVAIAKTHWS